jgi:hypothetical protein
MPFGAEFRWRTPFVATAMPGIPRLIQYQNSSAPYPQIQYWQTTSGLDGIKGLVRNENTFVCSILKNGNVASAISCTETVEINQFHFATFPFFVFFLTDH